MNADEPLDDDLSNEDSDDKVPNLPSDDIDRRVEEVAEEFLNRLRAGDSLDSEQLIAQHPDLAPHLETRLKLYRAIYRVTHRPSIPNAAVSDSTVGFSADSAATPINRDAAFRVSCPHCGNRLQLIGYNIAEVTCGSCGSAVRIDSKKFRSAGPQAQTIIPKQLGHFRLRRILGEGGFGVVFLAEDLNLGNRPVALKIPRHGFFATIEDERRFMREARNAARLRHPNIAQVYEISEDRNTPFIVSEFIEGMTLRDLAHSRSLSHREIADLMIQITEAVDFAHRNKIIHRDLKSSNVLVNHSQQAFVVDFGLSRRDDAELTVTMDGAVLGTVQYMSPEQAAGNQTAVGPWSDVYSMGVILYELLSHQLPFRGSKQIMINQVINEEPRSPRSLNEQVPRDLETITIKAMAKNPKQRYASAKELGDDLRRWKLGEPISARPVSSLVRGWSWCKRHPTTATLSAAVAGSLLLMSVISILWAIDQTRLKQRAVVARSESDRRQYELLMQNGSSALDRQELAEAALWFSEALTIKDVALNRTRIGMIQDQLPKLTQLWSMDSPVNELAFAGDRLVAVSWDGQVRVFDLLSLHDVFSQKLDPFSQFDISPTGDSLVMCGNENYARLWDVERKQLIKHLGHGDLVVSTDFHPSAPLLATGSFDSVARIWNAADGSLNAEHRFDGMRVIRVAFVPDSQLIAVVTQEVGQMSNAIHVWSYVDDRIVATGMKHQDLIQTLDFAEQGKRICTASRDGEVRIWDTASGSPVGMPFKLPFAPKRVLFGGSSERLVSITFDNDVYQWDIGTGQAVGSQIRNRDGYSAAAQDSSNRLMALAGTDGKVRTYWLKSGSLACSVLQNSENALSVAFHRDGRRLAVGGSNGVLQLWDLAGAAAESHVFEHDGAVRNALFSPDQKRCLTIGLDGSAFLWDADTGQKLGTALKHSGGISECAVSPDGKVFATAGNDKRVKLWNGFDGVQLGVNLPHDAPVATLAFSPNGERLMTGCNDGTVSCWDTRQVLETSSTTENVQQIFKGKHEARIMCIAFSPRGKLAATASLDGMIRCWNSDTGNQQFGPLRHPNASYCLVMPDGEQLLSCGSNGWAYIWNMASGEIVHRLRCSGSVKSAQLFDKGRGILTNENKGRTRIWQRGHVQFELANTLQHDSIESVYFSDLNHDATILACVGGSPAIGSGIPKAGGAVLWDVQEQRLIAPPLKHLAPVRRVYFDALGKKLLTVSEDRTARLWRLVSNEFPRQEAIRIARLYVQQKINSAGRLISVPPQEQVAEFSELAGKYPTAFRCNANEIQLWNDDATRLHAPIVPLPASADAN